ncbi:MAG: DUF1631 family protein [Pseudomonadota bacterium]
MNASNQHPEKESISGEDLYIDTVSLCKDQTNDMLIRMIDSADDYHGWSLSDQDGARVVKLIKHKQRILCSSFSFQLTKYYEEFRQGGKSRSQELGARDWQALGLDSNNTRAEIDVLQNITERYSDAFKEFDRSILKRLQACLKRSRASVYENPLQVKRLCESFRYAIDSLNLESNFKIALYSLFADRFIETLGPFYRRIDRHLSSHGMLPEIPQARIQLRSIEGLSESEGQDSIQPDQSICLLILLQRFKEKSRLTGSKLQNLFPDLKQRFNRHGLSGFDEQIDQLNLIFKLIFEDDDLPEPVKQQLGRLQIYVFITAIQEHDFLRRSSNPARRLLDGIISSEVEIARKGHSEYSGISFISDHIDSLTQREFITLESYTEMLEGYQQFIETHEKETRRAKKQEATRKIMPQVKSKLDELTQPLKIQGTSLILFEKVWLPLMLQIALQQGLDSDAWTKALSMVRKQVWAMIPKSTVEEQIELVKTLPRVSHSLHRAMRGLKLADSLQQSLGDYMKLAEQEVLDKTTFNIKEKHRRTRSLGEQSFEAMKDNNDEFDEMMQTGMFQVSPEMMASLNSVKSPPKKVNQADALNKGEWVNIRIGMDTQLAKLAWKAEDASLFIFVDRDGSPVCELKASEVAEKFESGEISLLDSGTVSSEKTQFSFLKKI